MFWGASSVQKQEEKLSIWVLLLRILAGYLNVTAILLFARMLAGHTGSFTNVAIEFVEGDMQSVFRILVITLFFFIGTIVSGYIYPSDKMKPSMRYGTLFILMGFIYLLFGILGYATLYFLVYLSFVLGFQNGMFVYYKGMVVRTTILTGTMTDIGVEIGRRFKGLEGNDWKLKFHIFNLVFFILGAVIAAFIAYYTDWNLVLGAGILEIGIGLYFNYARNDLFSE